MPDVAFINPGHLDPPIGQYSQLSMCPAGAQFIHVAGQLPLHRDGTLVAETFEEQMEHVLRSLDALLRAAGSSMTRIVHLRSYLTRVEDYAVFREVRARVFERYGVESAPPATTVVVAALVGGSLIEVDAVAVAVGGEAGERPPVA